MVSLGVPLIIVTPFINAPGSGNNAVLGATGPGTGTTSGTAKIQESGISGISSAIGGTIQTQVSQVLANGARPSWMTISARTSNWTPPEMALIFNQFLSYTGNYRI